MSDDLNVCRTRNPKKMMKLCRKKLPKFIPRMSLLIISMKMMISLKALRGIEASRP